ncbi:MAG: hypothetical protein AB1505_25345 [Candidatus Latescibacterota bacterium]
MPVCATETDPRETCRLINARSPVGGLFEGDRSHLHPDSRLPWRISPEPFWLTPPQARFLEELGEALHAFYRAANLLYHQSTRGIQPAWVHEYLDLGKPAEVVELGRMNRFRTHTPVVIRPDLLLTPDGFRLTELDSVPGGMGFTAQVTALYAELGYELIGGAEGLAEGFYAAIASACGTHRPVVALVVSDESESYREEMEWLAGHLAAQGRPIRCVHPRELRFDDRGLQLETDGVLARVDAVYRFFELFDLKNIPKVEPVVYFAKKNAVRITPPLKAFLEEKMWLALLHHPQLRPFWDKELGAQAHARLLALVPRTWIVDARPVPPHAVVAGLHIDGQPVREWTALQHLTKKQREFVLKPSGFSDLAYESRGVSVGHDLPEEEWAGRLREALDRFPRQPYVLQDFHKAARCRVQYYDFHRDEMRAMRGRALVRPYYYLMGDRVRLAGVQAVVCPLDKKVLHGMVDAVLVPCGTREGTEPSAPEEE